MYRAHLGEPSSSQMRRAKPAAPLTNATLDVIVSGWRSHIYYACNNLLCLACTNRQQRTADHATLAWIESTFQCLQRLVWLVDAAGVKIVLDQVGSSVMTGRKGRGQCTGEKHARYLGKLHVEQVEG